MKYKEIRILPMDKKVEFNNRSIFDVQEQYFLTEMPSRLKKPENYQGIYCYKSKRMKVIGNGMTLILFQYDNRIIACADLLHDEPNLSKIGYAGYYVFLPPSIKVFSPMDSTVISCIFGKKIKFGQATHILDPLKADEFFTALDNIICVSEKDLKLNIEWSCIP